MLLNNGDGTFQPAVSHAVGKQLIALVTGDFNGDGNTDVAVSSGCCGSLVTTTVTVLLGNGDGTFRSSVNYGAGAIALAVGDLNGDVKPDLVMRYSTDSAQVLLNTYVPGGGGPSARRSRPWVASALPSGGVSFTEDARGW